MFNRTRVMNVVFLFTTLVLALASSGLGQTGGPFAVHVTVIDTLGKSVMNDTVQFIDSLDGINQSMTSASGVFPISLPAGSYSVRIIAPGYPMQYYAGLGTSSEPMVKFQVHSDTSLLIRLTVGAQGVGVVSGFVYDSAGSPIANSMVTVTSVTGIVAPSTVVTAANGSFSAPMPATGAGLFMLKVNSPAYPPQFWTPTGMSSSPPATATNGLFLLAPNDTFRVTVKLSMNPSSGSSGTQTMHIVHVTVSDSSGTLVPNDTVMFIDSLNNINQSMTSPSGVFSISIPAGAYTVRIIASGYPVQYYDGPGTTSQPMVRFLVNSDTVLPVRLTIGQQGTVAGNAVVDGSVYDSAGSPLGNSVITVVSLSGTSSANATSDLNGYFSASVPLSGSGQYWLMIHFPGYPPQYWTPAGTISTVPTSATTGVFTLFPRDTFRVMAKLSMHPASGGTVTGSPHVVRVRVLTDTGGIATGCDVQFIDTSNYVREGIVSATGDLPMSLPTSQYQVRLSYSGYPVQYYNVPVNSDWPKGWIFITSDTLLVFTLTQTPMKINSSSGAVSGVVQDSLGKPVRSAKVTLTQVGTNIVSAAMMTDSSGRFLASVQAMSYTINVSSAQYPAQYWTPGGTTLDPYNNTTFQVMAGETVTVVIKMSTHPGSAVYVPPDTQHSQTSNAFVAGHVFVKATNLPAAGIRVIAVPRDTSNQNSKLYVDQYNAPYSDTVKSDGSYRIGNLPRGQYWVYARGGAFINQYYPQTDYSDSSSSILADSAGRSGIDFFLRTGGVITGQLTSTVISDLDTIAVFANLDNSSLRQSAYNTSGGRFSISGLVSGTWNLSIDQSRGFFIDNSASAGKPSEVTVVEGKTDTGVVLVVSRGGFVSGTLSQAAQADTMNGGQFEVDLYADSILRSSNPFPYEIQSTWASPTTTGSYVSGTITPGAYRVMFRPYAPLIPRIDTVKYVTCRSYTMASTGPTGSLLHSPLLQVVAGDTTPGVAARFGPGFSFLGPFSLEGGARPNWAHVDACIKDSNDYITVCHGYVTTGDTMFQLSGLLDEKDYYLRCDADGYPTQWWSPDGSMSSAPATPYHFSTLNFARPSIRMVKVPSGYYNNYTPFWVNTVFDSTNHLTVQWNIDVSTVVDSFILYSKDRAGALSTMTRVPYVSGQTQYVWKETRNLSANQYSYVVVGKAQQYTIRSGTAGYDYNSGTPVPADSLWFSVLSGLNGVTLVWTGGKNYTYTDRDSIVVNKKTGASGTWSQLSKQWARNTWLNDNQIDKVADLGKTFYYQINLVRPGSVTRWSAIRPITIDSAFVNHLSNRLAVGQSEQFKKIQDAVDNARDNDEIDIDPGTYVENVTFRGKVLTLNGNWSSGGIAPVIDASGATAITVPYPLTGSSGSNIAINGLKIQNALVGINSSGDVNVNQCLFVNVVKQGMVATIDSASLVRSAQSDPFNQYNVQMNAWQCTFIGGSGAGAVARVGSQGTYESSTGSTSAILTNPAMMVPATSFSSSVSVNNSILSGFNGTGVPLDMYGSRGHANFANSDFFSTSAAVASTYQNQITMDPTIFTVDPHFVDNTNYFLPDSSPLRTMANNGSGIGYDERRFNNNNGASGNGAPGPAAVQNFHFVVVGPHSVRLTWSPLGADQNSVRYIVYRVLGYDSLWYVNQGQWSPKVANSAMFSIMDTFSTKDTFFVDSTPKLNVPYLYAVSGISATGAMGNVYLPFPPTLSSYTALLKPLSVATGMRTTVLSFTSALCAWSSPIRGAAFTVYKIGLAAAAGPDSAGLRTIIQTRAFASIDSFVTRDSLFIDSSLVFGKPYCFVVALFDSTAGVRLPLGQMPFAFSYVRISGQTFASAQSIRLPGQAWSMTGPWGTSALNFANATSGDIYHWDDLKQSDKLYSQYSPVTEMKPGLGYWFMPATDTVLSIDTGAVAALSAAGVQKLSLSKGATGWNQVASALPYAVSPSWLKTFTAYEWDADSNQYVQASILNPWKGYWIFSGADTALPLSGLPVAANLAKKAVAGAQWQLRVSLAGKKSRDPDNYCGTVPQSLAKTVSLASPKPPQAFDYPQLFFVDGQQKLARLYKSAAPGAVRQEWTVGISPSAEDMTVSVDGIASVPQKAFVFMVERGVIYDLRKKSTFPVAAHKETVYGYIVVTTDSREMALYTGNVELRRAYPNPFTNNAFIEFTLPYSFGSNGAKLEGETRNISLDIFNIAGRHISTLVSGNQQVGYYRKVWTGTNDGGSTVSSGFYIVRLCGQKFQKTSTLFKIR